MWDGKCGTGTGNVGEMWDRGKCGTDGAFSDFGGREIGECSVCPGNPPGNPLVFSSSTATPGGSFPLQITATGGGQSGGATFTLSTQVTTFQVTSVTGSGIVQNTGQEVQITQSVPANNAPTYTTCSTADPNVTCQVISSAPGTVTLGVTASTSAVHGNRVLQLNGGAGTGHLTVADWEGVDTLTSIVPSTIQAGQSEPATIYGSMLDPDCEEDEDCAAVGDDDGPDEPDEWRDYADQEDLEPGEPAFIERGDDHG